MITLQPILLLLGDFNQQKLCFVPWCSPVLLCRCQHDHCVLWLSVLSWDELYVMSTWKTQAGHCCEFFSASSALHKASGPRQPEAAWQSPPISSFTSVGWFLHLFVSVLLRYVHIHTSSVPNEHRSKFTRGGTSISCSSSPASSRWHSFLQLCAASCVHSSSSVLSTRVGRGGWAA